MSLNPRNVLVVGGAGYIGSQTAKALARSGFTPITFDNLSSGHRWSVRYGPFVEGNAGNAALLLDTIYQHDIGAVIHLAAFASVAESTARPEIYFDNNVVESLVLLNTVLRSGIRYVVFSSSCSVYGAPTEMPIKEDTVLLPINPYGETKVVIERALHWFGAAHDLSWSVLRYFNAAGADPEGDLGEVHSPETHLIPLIFDAAMGRNPIEVYGTDYPTPDGTCIRDFVHVLDIADAHVRALNYLIQGGTSLALNLGAGEGHSVKEVIETAHRVTGLHIPFRIASRRSGDPAILVAASTRAAQVLDWNPLHSTLDYMIRTAWNWHQKRGLFE